MTQAMSPAGYLYKTVARRPQWLAHAPHVVDVLALSGCICAHFLDDYETHWRHNCFFLFDDPATMRDIARAENVDLTAMTLVYFERFDEEFHAEARSWKSIPAPHEAANVTAPARKTLRGYDVNCASQGFAPECSPLSCNALCEDARVNAHCLFDTFEAAKAALESGLFDNSEPGPFRVYAVYTVEQAPTPSPAE